MELRTESRHLPSAALLALVLCVWVVPPLLGEETSKRPVFTAEELAFYDLQVKPLLEQHCLRCHGAKGTPKGGFRLISRELALLGGDSGPAVEPGHPDDSLLVQAINYEGYEMPPSGKLPQASIDVLTKWVKLGLPWSENSAPTESLSRPGGPPRVDEQARQFWSFQPVRRPAVPVVKDSSRIVNPIDAFITAKVAAAGLERNGPAGKTAWLRRAYYDLIGLPPSPSEVATFAADSTPEAKEKVIDRLLESPHYGERWGRHWLDLVRYAETNSYERDGAKPFVWRYRDYVIRSFNEDKPYDQFIREQLAGDELDPVTPETLIATGYYRLGIWDDEPADPEQALFDDLDDLVQTTGQVFLGMTIGCARCHDHKIDPIPQRDYYQFLSFFRNVRRYGVRSHDSVVQASLRSIASSEDERKHAEKVKEYEAQVASIKDEIDAWEKKLRNDLAGVERDEFKTEAARLELARKRVPGLFTEEAFQRYQFLFQERERLRNNRPAGLAQALCVTEAGRTAPPTHILVRGNAHVPGDEVQPGFLSVLDPPRPSISALPAGVESTGRRLALANWLASADNPLTPRVIANRIWQYHFGRGIVRTSSDFGYQGISPTHPELLDWLAAELVEGGWRIKRLHKLIMLSSTYGMSSEGTAKSLALDPENNLFWRFDPRRLSAEEVRDSMLAVNGSLNRDKMFGPSIYVRMPEAVLAGQSRPGDGWGKSSPEDENRRSIYIHVKRSLVTPILAAFDAADTDSSCPVRFATTQPTQALGMLNSEFIQEQSRTFAAYLRREAGQEPREQVQLALARALQREPSGDEIQTGLDFMTRLQLQSQQPVSSDDALRYFCLLVLNLNEFLYLD